jgi:hypothetical protein
MVRLIQTFLEEFHSMALRVKKKKEVALASLFYLISRLDLATGLAFSPVVV